jgi:uncharacterized protein (TIGR03435 family)
MFGMKASVRSLCGIVTAALLAAASAAFAAPPSFEVADVHPSPQRLHPQIHGHFVKDHVVLRSATLNDLVAAAYHVEPADIVGAPVWFDHDRFDLNAKAPEGTKFSNQDDDPQAAAMLRTLLSDRFGLVVKQEKRPLPAFVLTAGKAPKLKTQAGRRHRHANPLHLHAG